MDNFRAYLEKHKEFSLEECLQMYTKDMKNEIDEKYD